MAADDAVARARGLIGVPFRLHGRDALGLDCVGLAACAYGARGAPQDYDLRSNAVTRWVGVLDTWFSRRGDGRLDPGDVLLMRAGPVQLHLGVWTGAGFVHAHAGLRRVVETPGAPPWPLLGIWFSRKEQ
jgi:cell wall-associated NlpC family hydrolase